MKILKRTLFLVIIGLVIWGCDETTDPIDVDDQVANQFAQAGFTLLNQKLLDMEELDDIPETGDELFSQADYDQIKTQFELALAENPDNALANFGMGIIEIAKINYDQELWDMISDFDAELGSTRILNKQFSFLFKSSFFTAKSLEKSLTREAISIARVQDYIDKHVISRLQNSLDYLATAIALPDSVVIIIDTGEEILELDRAEIYAFRASVNAVIAGMKMITLYDLDMYDEDGGYDWLDQLDYNDYNELESYDYNSDTGTLTLNYLATPAEAEQQILEILHYNLTEREDFGEYRSGNSPVSIKNNMEACINDMDSMISYIEQETDDQSNDVIKYDYIIEMNDDISNLDPDAPNFTANWENLHDVMNWMEELMDSEVTFNEDLNGDGQDTEIVCDLSKMFDPGLTDLKEYLPYHNWFPHSEWLQEDTWTDSYYYGGTYYIYFQGETIMIENVGGVTEVWTDQWIEPAEMLDDMGEPIDMDYETVYLPDYTLNGIFPNMTRELFLEIMEED